MTCFEQILSDFSADHPCPNDSDVLTASGELFLHLTKALNVIDVPNQILWQALRKDRVRAHREYQFVIADRGVTCICRI